MTTYSAPGGGLRGRWLAAAAVLTAITLAASSSTVFFDTNFYVLWEATGLLAGDHPYRDFFEWGVPLQMLLSAAGQWLSGNRLIGEFAIHWLAIIAGVVLAVDAGYRVSRSVLAALGMLVCILPLVAVTPTFHYPKLLLYPLAIEAAWWYLDRPGVRRGMVLGALVAAAFLLRHDHGLFVGGLVALTMLAARLPPARTRRVRGLLVDAGAGLTVVAALLLPWAALVHRTEGLSDYVRHRYDLFADFSTGGEQPLLALRDLNPAVMLAGETLPPAAGIVRLEWDDGDGASPTEIERRRVAMERRLGLEATGPPGAGDRWEYRVANVNDPRLFALDGFVRNVEGLDLGRLESMHRGLPSADNAIGWLMQMALLVPLLLVASAAAAAVGAWRRGEAIPIDAWRLALAAVFLIAIESQLFRERGYALIVAPLIASLSTVFLVWRPRDRTPESRVPLRRVWLGVRTAAAVSALLLSLFAVYAYTRNAVAFVPAVAIGSLGPTSHRLLAAPPIDGFLPRAVAQRWNRADAINPDVIVRYLHDCTRDGDRILITGNTPYHISYLTGRPIAGGQLFWHHRWRTGPDAQRQHLALLQRQSVPFAFSTADPVFTDLVAYPPVLDYLRQHYVEVPGTAGLLLVDRRRTPTGSFGAVGLPCFGA